MNLVFPAVVTETKKILHAEFILGGGCSLKLSMTAAHNLLLLSIHPHVSAGIMDELMCAANFSESSTVIASGLAIICWGVTVCVCVWCGRDQPPSRGASRLRQIMNCGLTSVWQTAQYFLGRLAHSAFLLIASRRHSLKSKNSQKLIFNLEQSTCKV